MLVLPAAVLSRLCAALMTVVAMVLPSGLASAQACSGVPTPGAARLVTGLHVDGHAYGSSRFAFVGLRPWRGQNAWVTVGAGRTSDPQLLLRSLAMQIRAEWIVRLPFEMFVCPVVAVSAATADDRITDSGVTATWRDADWGLSLGRTWRLNDQRAVILALRGRTGRTHARRASPFDTREDRWPYQMLEGFVGILLDERFIVRPSVTYFRFRMTDPLSPVQPLARADGEVGLGLLLGFVF